MGMPSACWRRPDNLAVTSSACRKQGELGIQSFLQQDTEFSALGKKKRKAGKDCMELVWQLGRRFAVSPFIPTSLLTNDLCPCASS